MCSWWARWSHRPGWFDHPPKKNMPGSPPKFRPKCFGMVWDVWATKTQQRYGTWHPMSIIGVWGSVSWLLEDLISFSLLFTVGKNNDGFHHVFKRAYYGDSYRWDFDGTATTGWWFESWWFQICVIFHPKWDDSPQWLIYLYNWYYILYQ